MSREDKKGEWFRIAKTSGYIVLSGGILRKQLGIVVDAQWPLYLCGVRMVV